MLSSDTIKAVKNHDLDNVATIFSSGTVQGNLVEVSDPRGIKTIFKALHVIPFGHKIAISNILKNEQVTKYGEAIGIATTDIKVGEHVHIHNVDSIRGRGDWERMSDQ